MHGLIYATWEKYLAERFGPQVLNRYRLAIKDTSASIALASRVYDDETFLKGLEATHTLTHFPTDKLLREFGYYFMINGLTSHLCAYLLNQVHSGYELLLAMRQAHAQLKQAGALITLPLFEYQAVASKRKALVLQYESPRRLCSLLLGAIEGAATRYGERVEVKEQSCMKQGAQRCIFIIRFSEDAQQAHPPQSSPEQLEHVQSQYKLADAVYAVLPDQGGCTLAEVRGRLRQRAVPVRLAALVEALNHLQHAGWVASTADQPGDTLASRRYWRIPEAFTDTSQQSSWDAYW